jgi:hypothetical protein
MEMRPTRVQRLFAQDWPMRLTLSAGALGMMAWAAPALLAALQPSFFSIAYFVFLMVVAALIGLIVASLAGGIFFLRPLYHWRGIKNGAPYQVGDEVLILAGFHRNRVARVYELWPERQQVRVDLGEKERRDVTDVFSYVEICRRSAAG